MEPKEIAKKITKDPDILNESDETMDEKNIAEVVKFYNYHFYSLMKSEMKDDIMEILKWMKALAHGRAPKRQPRLPDAVSKKPEVREWVHAKETHMINTLEQWSESGQFENIGEVYQEIWAHLKRLRF